MDFQAFLGLLRRQWITLAVIVFATTFAASAIFFLQPPEEKLTLLFSVGVTEGSASEKGFDATKAADDFAKTVAGWLRSPTLAGRVSGISGTPVRLAALPQAKQNFLVEASFGEGSSDTISVATKKVLGEEIDKYNTNSKFKFFTTTHGESTSNSRGHLPKTLAAAAVGGALLAIAWIVLVSSFSGRVSSIREVEKILKVKAAVVFQNPKKHETAFLKKLAKKTNHAVLIGADISVAKLREKLQLNMKTAELPNDADKLGKNESKIVVVKLDTTKANTLRMLRAVFEEKIKLVIWS
jgi:hypothetical protein